MLLWATHIKLAHWDSFLKLKKYECVLCGGAVRINGGNVGKVLTHCLTFDKYSMGTGVLVLCSPNLGTEKIRDLFKDANLLGAELSLLISRPRFWFEWFQHVVDSIGSFGDGGTSVNEASGSGVFIPHFKSKQQNPSINHLKESCSYSQLPMTTIPEHSIYKALPSQM